MSEEGQDEKQSVAATTAAAAAPSVPPPQQVQLLWPPPMLRGGDGGGLTAAQLVNLVACKTKCNLDSNNDDDDVDNNNNNNNSKNAFPSGVGLFHQNGRIVFDKAFYPALSDPSKETQDILCEYVQSSCQEQGFFVRRKQYAKPESNRSKTWRLRLRCKKTSCSFKMNFCWDVEKQYWFIPTGKDGDFVHKCGWTGPPTSNLTTCMPCTTTSSTSKSAIPATEQQSVVRYQPGREEVASDPMNHRTASAAVKRVMRLPLSRKKKKAKSTSGVEITAPSTPNTDEYNSQTMPFTKSVTPTPGGYRNAHSSHEFDMYGSNNSYTHSNHNSSNRHRLSAAFSRRVRPAIRNTSHHYNHDASGSSGGRHASLVSPIEPPPFPTTNKKPQEPLQIISAAPPASMAGQHHHHRDKEAYAQQHDDRDASDAVGDDGYLSATLEDMDISDNEEGSHAEILAQISPRLFSNDEEQEHLAAADKAQQQLGDYDAAANQGGGAHSGSYHGYMSEQQQQGRRQEDGYSSSQYSSSSLFYQLHQQAVDYCSQPYTTTSSTASAASHARYFSWNFLDYCCAPGGSDYYDGNHQYNNTYRHPESPQHQHHQQNYQVDVAPTSTGRGGYQQQD